MLPVDISKDCQEVEIDFFGDFIVIVLGLRVVPRVVCVSSFKTGGPYFVFIPPGELRRLLGRGFVV